MRITGQKPVSGVKGRDGKKRVGSDGSVFSPDMGDEASSAAPVSSASPMAGMDGLLALQEVEERPARSRSRATKRGHSLLDGLEAIRADLLAGVVQPARLEALSRELKNTVHSGDEEVDSVLKEIELRVHVELAKLGRFPS